ncbi:MAG: hypothetical protein HYZ89_06755 [Candidatus Omnitrophica bacterium]|nr:hypothetical protein [Candidatus Omnitrophota bacterium]
MAMTVKDVPLRRVSGFCRKLPVGLAAMLTFAGCAGVSPTQVGQTAGSVAGAALVPGLGMPIGALVGTLAGLVIEQHVDKVRERKEQTDLSKELKKPRASGLGSVEAPPVGQPTRVWVDEHLQGGRLVIGHFEQRILP